MRGGEEALNRSTQQSALSNQPKQKAPHIAPPFKFPLLTPLPPCFRGSPSPCLRVSVVRLGVRPFALLFCELAGAGVAGTDAAGNGISSGYLCGCCGIIQGPDEFHGAAIVILKKHVNAAASHG